VVEARLYYNQRGGCCSLNQKNLFERIWETFVSSFRRNETVVKAVGLTFFGVIVASVVVTAVAFSVSPTFFEWFKSLLQDERSYVAIPPPYSNTLFSYILLNNIGHFWNPIRMLVWVPLVGALVMGFELLLNGVFIGAVATAAGFTRGIAYPVLGLVPHGVFEIPAFILGFTSIIRWQVTVVEAVMSKITGEKVNRPKFRQGLKDTVILAVASVILFVIAALIETYVTPYLLGM
jgi:stage II sporulation protein M